MPLSLHDQCQIKIISNRSIVDSLPLHLLPQEIIDSLLLLLLKKAKLSIELLSKLVASKPITELDLSLLAPKHEKYSTPITDKILELLSKCDSLRVLSIH
jgi:hypothetical protein